MKFCSITPLKNAELMYEKEYVMLLAHLSKKSDYYADLARKNKNYKIMDNSIIELGSAFSMEELVKEALRCKVDEIILPDVFKDGPATIEAVRHSIRWLKEHRMLGYFKLMAVCHGKDKQEFFKTFKTLNSMDEVDVIGVPKVTSTIVKSRVELAEHIALLTRKEVHLLGCWYTLRELKELSSNTPIRSIDTCMPALLSIYNMETYDDRNDKRIDLEEDEVNLENYRRIMKEINI